MSIDINDPATWNVIPATSTDQPTTNVPLTPFTPKMPTLAPASPPVVPPSAGNAIVGNPPSWPKILIMSVVVGLAIWLVEQNVGTKYAMMLAVILLLGAAFNYKNFTTQLSLVMGK